MIKIKETHKKARNQLFKSQLTSSSDLEKVCSWLSIIDTGKIIEQGNVNDLAEKYSANIYKIDISNPQLFAENIQALRAVEKVWIEMDIVYAKSKIQI